MAKSAYIHIPFCAHKCDFCDFAAFAGVDELSSEYCNIVVKEIEERQTQDPNSDLLTSLFYGGGTPGYIDPKSLGLIHKCVERMIGFGDNAEITIETTPQSITLDKARYWRQLGINRISIGVQSFSDSELQAMGRDHLGHDALRAIDVSRQAGFNNISIDLMYGLPEQTIDSWQKNLERAASLDLSHISAYGLTIEQNSPLLLRYPKDCGAYPSEDDFVTMYKMLVSGLGHAGLSQYEVSNFSKPGFESVHNLAYWSNDEYLAFGVSAHRYFNGVRSSNYRSLSKYMRDYLHLETKEVIDDSTRMIEAIFLGLRTRKGINLEQFQRRYGFDLHEVLSGKIERLTGDGFLTIEEGWLRLSQDGVLISNLILSELI